MRPVVHLRQPAGAPTGGEFAAHDRAESTITLEHPSGSVTFTLSELVTGLEAQGHSPERARTHAGAGALAQKAQDLTERARSLHRFGRALEAARALIAGKVMSAASEKVFACEGDAAAARLVIAGMRAELHRRIPEEHRDDDDFIGANSALDEIDQLLEGTTR